MKSVLAFVLFLVLTIAVGSGLYQLGKLILPIECKHCLNCGHEIRWQGGLPGQMRGPCPLCGGVMANCQ